MKNASGIPYRYAVFFVPLVFFFVGCGALGTYNPATGRNEIVLISTPSEVAMGRDLDRALHKEYSFITTGPAAQRLARVGSQVAKASDRQDYTYQFSLIQSDEINAFTTPGGNVYVFRGLMDRIKRDDQLAGVIAHEIGHCAAKHVVKRYQSALGYNLLGSIVVGIISPQAQGLASLSSQALGSLVFSAYGRTNEYEADRLAVKYMMLAGYDPQGMIEVLEMLKAHAGREDGLLILRSHPYLDDRIAAVSTQISSGSTTVPSTR